MPGGRRRDGGPVRLPAPRADRRRRRGAIVRAGDRPARDARLPLRSAAVAGAAGLPDRSRPIRIWPPSSSPPGRRCPRRGPSPTSATSCSPRATACSAISTRSTCARTGASGRCSPSRSPPVCPRSGADFAAYPIGATAGWAVAPGGSAFGLAQVMASARARSGDLIDQRLGAVLYFASPPIAGVARVVAAASTDAVRADTYRTRFFLGGDTGLRGYQIGEFQGTGRRRRARGDPHRPARRVFAALRRDPLLRRRARRRVVRRAGPAPRLRRRPPLVDPSAQRVRGADRLGDRDRRGSVHPPRVARPHQRRLRAVVLAPGLPEGLPAAVLVHSCNSVAARSPFCGAAKG